MEAIKNSKQLLDEFFSELISGAENDDALSPKIKDLYEKGKLTETNIKNLLDKIINEEA